MITDAEAAPFLKDGKFPNPAKSNGSRNRTDATPFCNCKP